MFAIDCETTGVDLYHGAVPFFVTVCDYEGEQTFWEWDVDPETRLPLVPSGDLEEISTLLGGDASAGSAAGTVPDEEGEVAGQNIKFDVAALTQLYGKHGGALRWPWDRTRDTLIAGHLLASNQPHDLTTMAVRYLGVNIEPYEERLQKAVQDARRYARVNFPDWRLAKYGLHDMPSCPRSKRKTDRGRGQERDTAWRYDSWLPRAVAARVGLEPGHAWWSALREYANVDSAITAQLWRAMRVELFRKGLWEVFLEQMRLPAVVLGMERRGVTVSGARSEELRGEFSRESSRCGSVCVNLAARYVDAGGVPYELTLPKNGVNGSLRTFCFDVMNLEPIYNSKAKTHTPTLDSKVAIPHYLNTLPPSGRERAFISALTDKRAYDTALSYLESYQRFMLPAAAPMNPGNEWWVLHPSLNQTGTDTLRFTCSNPNAQQISKKETVNLRYVFGPTPGREWWSLDAKNIELRLPAYESGEEAFIALFERPDESPYFGSNHLLISHILHPEKFEECRDERGNLDGRVFKKRYAATLYQWVKNGNFAVQYGAIDREDGLGTADRTYHLPGAQARIKARFGKQEALNQRWIRFAEGHGYVETMPDRTVDPKRGYPLLCARTGYGKVKPTVPLNYHIQGTAMWWMRRAMVRCQEQLDRWNENGFDGHIVLQVHDELVFDFPALGDPSEDYRKEKLYGKLPLFRTSNLWRVRALQSLMAQGGEDLIPRVPTPVGCEYHAENWAEGVTVG